MDTVVDTSKFSRNSNISVKSKLHSTTFLFDIRGGPEEFFLQNLRSRGIMQQGWEFAHRFSERIARFMRKNEQMIDFLKKQAIRSLPHFW